MKHSLRGRECWRDGGCLPRLCGGLIEAAVVEEEAIRLL